MFRSLRNRLILSHVLPILIILPVMGFALAYLLETRYLLPQIADELSSSAALLAKVASNTPEIWISPRFADAVLRNTIPETSAEVMLLTPDSRLLASTIPVGPGFIGAVINFPDLDQVQAGKTVRLINYSPRQNQEAVDIFTPSISSDGHFMGIVRMTYRATIFYAEFNQFRELIAAILIFAMLITAAIGYFLALNISRPIHRATQQVYQLAKGELRDPQAEYGPEEVRLLIRATNYLVEQLSNLEQSRRQLLANLVHELGRPLGSLRSGIQALANGAWKEPALLGELTQGMDLETQRLEKLVDELAQLHSQSLGIMELDRQPLALNHWLPPVLSPWRQAAIEKRQHWSEDIPEGLPTIQADPSRLAQILGNLMSNAIKYTPVGGSIIISAGTEPEAIWLKVSDDGPGIALEEQEKIFSPYYRGEQGRRIRQGMGLGLSIARDLVSAHGGRLEIDSTPGLGSSFTVRLPRAQPESL